MDRLSDDLLCRIFTYLPSLRDLCQCIRVCKRWERLLGSENAEAWQQLLVECTPKKFREDNLIACLASAKAKLIAFECAWSDSDHSDNIEIKENSLTLHRKPVAQSTDAIRGKVGFTSGVHYWTVTWHGPSYGSNAVLGVATKKLELHGQGYFSLLGNDKEGESWGWDLSKRVLRFKGETLRKLPSDNDLKVRFLLCRASTTLYLLLLNLYRPQI